jgi:hypothetical protein
VAVVAVSADCGPWAEPNIVAKDIVPPLRKVPCGTWSTTWRETINGDELDD